MLEHQTLKSQEMLNFCVQTLSFLYVHNTDLQISKNKGRKTFLLHPAQLRVLRWWVRNLGPQSGPTHVFNCIVSGPVFHL